MKSHDAITGGARWRIFSKMTAIEKTAGYLMVNQFQHLLRPPHQPSCRRLPRLLPFIGTKDSTLGKLPTIGGSSYIFAVLMPQIRRPLLEEI